MVARGEVLFQQLHCTACHTTDGSRAAGPTMKGLYGSAVVLDNGQTVVADADYIRESIVNPDAQVRRGYAPQVMGSATDDIRDQLLADDNVNALVVYIESLK
jgi:cytochrome c oxidase subunit 2